MPATDIGALVKNIGDDVKTIVQGEIALAKKEIVPQVKKAAAGSGMFAAAAYFAMCMLALLFMAGGFGFGQLFLGLGMPVLGATALGFCCMALVLLLLAVILALIGKAQLKVKGPERAINEGKAAVEDVKTAVARGQEDVKSGVALERAVAEDRRALAVTEGTRPADGSRPVARPANPDDLA